MGVVNPVPPGFEVQEIVEVHKVVRVLRRIRRCVQTLVFAPGRAVPVTEDLPMPDVSGYELPADHHVDVVMTFADQDGQPIVPPVVTIEATTPETISVTPHEDPASGFVITAVAGASGPFQVKVTYGDAAPDPGVQTAFGFFAGQVAAGKFVAGINFAAGAPEPNA